VDESDDVGFSASSLEGAPLDELSQAQRRVSYTQSQRPVRGAQIICPNPNCGYRGKGIKRRRSKWSVKLTLLFICVLFIVFYIISVYSTEEARMGGATTGIEMIQIQEDAAYGGGGNILWAIIAIAVFIGWLGYTIALSGKIILCPRCGMKARDL
jgi:hypothetical protein